MTFFLLFTLLDFYTNLINRWGTYKLYQVQKSTLLYTDTKNFLYKFSVWIGMTVFIPTFLYEHTTLNLLNLPPSPQLQLWVNRNSTNISSYTRKEYDLGNENVYKHYKILLFSSLMEVLYDERISNNQR